MEMFKRKCPRTKKKFLGFTYGGEHRVVFVVHSYDDKGLFLIRYGCSLCGDPSILEIVNRSFLVEYGFKNDFLDSLQKKKILGESEKDSFIEDVYKIAFGEGAIRQEFSTTAVLGELIEKSNKAFKYDELTEIDRHGHDQRTQNKHKNNKKRR